MKKGFTLIELLVAISIIAVLSVIGLTLYTSVQSKARDSVRKSDLQKLAIALEIYYQSNKIYPSGVFNSCSAGGFDNWSTFVNILYPNYMTQVPSDPQNTNPATLPEWYCYFYTSNDPIINPAPTNPTNYYVLGARLEAAPYFDAAQCPGRYYNFCPGTNCGGYHDISSGLTNFYGACSVNYVVTSPQ